MGCFAFAIQSFTIGGNASAVMPVEVTAMRTSRSFSVNFAIASLSPVTIALNGGLVFHSGCCGASSATRSKMNNTCE